MTNEVENTILQEPPQEPLDLIATPEATKPKSPSPVLKELMSHLAQLNTIDEKLQFCLESMQVALAYRVPRFKDYWEIKRLCLPLFKESLAPHARTQFWAKYIEISAEGRHLKKILDEQSDFAMEQIDLAIQAIEADLQIYQDHSASSSDWNFPIECHSIQSRRDLYETLQRELNLLNNFAARIHSLRKEVIRTEMRIRFKNKFFDRLSVAGDRVFPRRKELIKQVSTEFAQDVKDFSETIASEESRQKRSAFELREEVKAFQQLAKELTLDNQTFKETRLQLGQSWDLLKELDQERKKEALEKQTIFKKNAQLVLDKIKPFAERCLSPAISVDEAAKQAGDILNFMKTVELGREEVRSLKEEVAKARSPVLERLRKEHEAREKELEEAEKQKRDKIEDFKKRLKDVQDQSSELSVEQLLVKKEEFHKQLTLLTTTHAERELLEHALKEFRDHIHEKKEKALASLSPEERNSLQNLKLRLEDLDVQKQEIRKQLEVYRTALAGSGFDIEKAMHYRELFDQEKAHLERVNAAIEELEEKIDELENS